ncbi:asparaginase [Candidatus Planktophila versatilis]|uniref:L-asparaginase II n=1 Tax=Candidatus Planktophila versatilis TaxID=1884905 RepID=A0ABN5BAP6_9ACTN|nr:asparaginase [Candidatus Planktophila versatilis]ASY16721.1 L-asparaginase II [Candidatus Planktophila versatilis]
MSDAVLAQYVRDGVVESEHRGHLLALNADGSVNFSLGDPSHLIFPRSTVKCIQGAAMVRAGLKLEPRLLALGASSHSGSGAHIAAVREILALAKLDESALQCALDKPLGEAERRAWGDAPATRIAMNCSGKHAAMLLTCVTNNWPTDSYLDAAHPLQVAIKSELATLAGEKITLTSTDGCGAPLFLLSVAGLARAMRAITISTVSAHQSVMEASRAFPEMVAGVGRLTTQMISAVPGLYMKDGAEAVEVATMTDGRTLVFKVSDGSLRPFRVLVHAGLAKLGIDSPYEVENVLGGNTVIGTIRATF